jgi:hypothetical protein
LTFVNESLNMLYFFWLDENSARFFW